MNLNKNYNKKNLIFNKFFEEFNVRNKRDKDYELCRYRQNYIDEKDEL